MLPRFSHGRYQAQRLIGKGGMSSVYLCLDTQTNKRVAVKMFDQRGATSDKLLRRFEQEIVALQQVSHPYIVPLLDYHLDAQQSYLVMPYFESGSVSDRLAQTLYSPQESATLLTQVAFALDYAHSQGYFHTDLKASNLLLDREGRAYLSDFGLATSIAARSSISGEGDIFGTPPYMAPELFKGAPPSARSEVYALVIILYELLCGHRPFAAGDVVVLLNLHRLAKPPALHELNPAVPSALSPVLLKGLSKTPFERPASVGELAQHFSWAVSQLPTTLQQSRAQICPRPDLPVVAERETDTEMLAAKVLSRSASGQNPSKPSSASESDPAVPALKKGLNTAEIVLVGLALMVVVTLLLILSRR